jgi:hypothetical protein
MLEIRVTARSMLVWGGRPIVCAIAAAADPPQVDRVPRAVALTRLERPYGLGISGSPSRRHPERRRLS